MTIADAFSVAPNTPRRAALVAAFAGVQSAIADAEAARVYTANVAAQLVDDLTAVASKAACELRLDLNGNGIPDELETDDVVVSQIIDELNAEHPPDGDDGWDNATTDQPAGETPAVPSEVTDGDSGPATDPAPAEVAEGGDAAPAPAAEVVAEVAVVEQPAEPVVTTYEELEAQGDTETILAPVEAVQPAE